MWKLKFSNEQQLVGCSPLNEWHAVMLGHKWACNVIQATFSISGRDLSNNQAFLRRMSFTAGKWNYVGVLLWIHRHNIMVPEGGKPIYVIFHQHETHQNLLANVWQECSSARHLLDEVLCLFSRISLLFDNFKLQNWISTLSSLWP